MQKNHKTSPNNTKHNKPNKGDRTKTIIVPIELAGISGVKTHRSISFGHSGGFISHAFADRDMIRRFAEEALL